MAKESNPWRRVAKTGCKQFRFSQSWVWEWYAVALVPSTGARGSKNPSCETLVAKAVPTALQACQQLGSKWNFKMISELPTIAMLHLSSIGADSGLYWSVRSNLIIADPVQVLEDIVRPGAGNNQWGQIFKNPHNKSITILCARRHAGDKIWKLVNPGGKIQLSSIYGA